jgi:catechol 2,3-dioxygenase-like lactoylglutathione lyase family enzyme
MIDHTGLTVSDYAKSKEFYVKALAPLGYRVMMEFSEAGQAAAGFGESKPDFWVAAGRPNQPPLHIAFAARNRATVDAFYNAALAAGGRDNGPPGIRAHYHPNYYGAFVLDPDGHNIEAVCHGPAGAAAKAKRAAKGAGRASASEKKRAPAKRTARRKRR